MQRGIPRYFVEATAVQPSDIVVELWNEGVGVDAYGPDVERYEARPPVVEEVSGRDCC